MMIRLGGRVRSFGALTAMNCAGRKSKVTTVMTRIVAESLTAMSFRASVFLLIVCEVC